MLLSNSLFMSYKGMAFLSANYQTANAFVKKKNTFLSVNS